MSRAERHPSTATYLIVAAILTLLTAMEILAYQIRALAPVLIPVLLILMVAKFALVAMFYMHLRFDPPVLATIFVSFLAFAGVVTVALFLLFMYHRSLFGV